MIISPRVLLSLLLLIPSSSWLCSVTPQWESSKRAAFSSVRQLREVPAQERYSELGPLRLQAVYAQNFSLPGNLMLELKTKVMPGVVNWYANLLQVYNVKGSLTIPLFNVTNEPPLEIPDTDVFLYIESLYDDDDWVARAAAIVFDGGNSRKSPIGGSLEINTKMYNEDIPEETKISTIRHEIAHVLAFSPSLIGMYRDKDGGQYSNPIKRVTARGKGMSLLTTPKVVEKARIAFNCDSMEGVELEDKGGEGTEGSHWKKRIMFNEFMVGDDMFDPVYSDITFAVFEDSGWYTVDYSYTEQIKVGRGAGCRFLAEKCVLNEKTQFTGFCDTSDEERCSLYHTRLAHCQLFRNSTPIPQIYQYFLDPYISGNDELMDYCPYDRPYLNGDCRGRNGLPWTNDSLELLGLKYGGKVCDSCMCFTGTLIAHGFEFQGVHSGCHAVECRNSTAFVIVDNTPVECPFAGGNVANLSGFNGYLTCPPYFVLCGDTKPCVNDCYGFGRCVSGVCHCDEEHIGVDCSQYQFLCKTGYSSVVVVTALAIVSAFTAWKFLHAETLTPVARVATTVVELSYIQYKTEEGERPHPYSQIEGGPPEPASITQKVAPIPWQLRMAISAAVLSTAGFLLDMISLISHKGPSHESTLFNLYGHWDIFVALVGTAGIECQFLRLVFRWRLSDGADKDIDYRKAVIYGITLIGVSVGGAVAIAGVFCEIRTGWLREFLILAIMEIGASWGMMEAVGRRQRRDRKETKGTGTAQAFT